MIKQCTRIWPSAAAVTGAALVLKVVLKALAVCFGGGGGEAPAGTPSRPKHMDAEVALGDTQTAANGDTQMAINADTQMAINGSAQRAINGAAHTAVNGHTQPAAK